MDRGDYERAWAQGYDAGHKLADVLLKATRSADELRQMAEGVSDYLQQVADTLAAEKASAEKDSELAALRARLAVA